MLVLSRQKDQSIVIGDDIEITVVDIRGDKVRIGVSASKEISVHRKEVYQAIRREMREAARAQTEDSAGLGKTKNEPQKEPARERGQMTIVEATVKDGKIILPKGLEIPAP